LSHYRLKGTAGPLLNRTFPLGERLSIGQSADCDVQLEGLAAPGPAAELRIEGQQVLLVALNPSQSVFVNGEPADRRPLLSGDELRIGACRFILQAPGRRPERVLEPAAPRGRAAWLRWVLLALLLAALVLLGWRLGWY